MQENEFFLATADGKMQTFDFYQSDSKNPAVIIFMDGPGIRDELKLMCKNIAKRNYYVILPNLFYRHGGPSFSTENLENILDPKMVELNEVTTNQMIALDTKYLIEHILNSDKTINKITAVGFCMGGRHALNASAFYPEHILSSGVLHAGKLYTNYRDSPHNNIKFIKGKIYFGFAQNDPLTPSWQIEIIENELKRHNISYDIDICENTNHGFMFPDRFCYDEKAANIVWDNLFKMFKETIN